MAAENQGPNNGGKKRQNPSQEKRFDIPYFAHQQLDPRQFPMGVGAPIAESPAMQKRRRISICTVGKHDDDEEDQEDGETSIKYPGSDEDKKFPTLGAIGARRCESGTYASESAYRSNRIQGARPALAKKITVELDSDDDMIVRMKEAKYAEKDIAKRLADEDRTKYNPKTIGTRWARLKRIFAQHQDELLEADLTDWHDGDDDVLYQAVAKADQDIDTSINKMRARKWHMVADYVKVMKPVTNFGQNACQKRFNDLRDGKAKPTPESIVDPDEKTLTQIQARRDKESRLEEDRRTMPAFRPRKEADSSGT